MRQGCPLSPLLFNLYINDIVDEINLASKSPIILGEKERVNVMLYADDLIILALSEEELQKKMNVLQNFCNNNKLEINEKKDENHGI